MSSRTYTLEERAMWIREEWAQRLLEAKEISGEESLLLVIAPSENLRRRSEEKAALRPFVSEEGTFEKCGHPRSQENTYMQFSKAQPKSSGNGSPMCVICRRTKDRAYRARNRDRVRAWARKAQKRQTADPEKRARKNEKNRRWYERNKADVLARQAVKRAAARTDTSERETPSSASSEAVSTPSARPAGATPRDATGKG